MLIALEDIFCEILELACVVINAHMASMLGNSFGSCSVGAVSLPWTTTVSFSEHTASCGVYRWPLTFYFICYEYSVEKLRRGFGMRVPKLIVTGQHGPIIAHGEARG
jgi:hypothetical protein